MISKSQIVIVPLDKKGHWSKGDLLKQINFDNSFTMAHYDNNIKDNSVYTPQQLLVLDDEYEPIIGDIVNYPYGIGKVIEHLGSSGIEVKCLRCTLEKNPFNVGVGDEARFAELDVYTIIASYPQIEGTLPLSKETIQEWIDNGTPRECSVELQEWQTVYNSHINTAHLIKNNWKLVKTITPKPPFDDADMYFYERYKPDSQGNLILEFDKQHYEIDLDYSEEELTNEEAKEWCESIKQSYTPKEFLATLKTVPSENREKWAKDNKHLIVYTEASIIPTDEEIEEKGHNNYPYGSLMPIGSYDRSNYEEKKESYTLGYKQALKDLGYVE